MRFLPLVAVAVVAIPLPAGPPNVQKWIKINEVEYPVPFGMHPNDYREQLARSGIAMVNLHPLPTAVTYPRPPLTPAIQTTATLQQHAPVATRYQQPQFQTFYNGAYQYAVPQTVAPAQVAYGYNEAWQTNPVWLPNSNPSGARQWVKLREGTDPIEVPQGAEPQSYLDSIRHAKLRYLSEEGAAADQKGCNESFVYAASSMQGWRPTMEDAHLIYEDKEMIVFGVYDGHGGPYVSNFTVHNIIEELLRAPAYQDRNIEMALKSTYFAIDRALRSPDWFALLNRQMNKNPMSQHCCFFEEKIPNDSDVVALIHNTVECATCKCPTRTGPLKEIPRDLTSNASKAPDLESSDATESNAPEGNQYVMYNALSSVFRAFTKRLRKVEDKRQSVDGNRAHSSGCTAITVVIYGDTLYIANAGDSRAVLCRGSTAEPLSFDHKPTNMEERQRIYAAGGCIECGRVNGNLSLSRALGDLVYKQNTYIPADAQIVTASPDVNIVQLKAEDEFIIIGCDGIWEYHGCQETVDYILSRFGDALEPTEILEGLFDGLLSPNPTVLEYGCDNMSAILIDLQPFKRCRCDCHDTQRESYNRRFGIYTKIGPEDVSVVTTSEDVSLHPEVENEGTAACAQDAPPIELMVSDTVKSG